MNSSTPRVELDTHGPRTAPQQRLDRGYRHLLGRSMGNLNFFKPFAENLRKQIRRLPLTPSEYGIIHCDLVPDNLLFDQAGNFTIIDFDHCAYGWRAYDIVPSGYTNKEVFSQVLYGYESVRPLSKDEREMLPVFIKLRQIWGIGDVLGMNPVWGETPSDEDLTDYVQILQNLT